VLEVFLVLAKITITAVSAVLWLSSNERTVARLTRFGTLLWRPALAALALMPVGLVVGSRLGCVVLAPVESTWLATLAGPLALGDPWRSPATIVITLVPLAAILSLPLRPRWWTGLLAQVGFVVWCALGFVFGFLAVVDAGC
jgi:hypothetical protein